MENGDFAHREGSVARACGFETLLGLCCWTGIEDTIIELGMKSWLRTSEDERGTLLALVFQSRPPCIASGQILPRTSL